MEAVEVKKLIEKKIDIVAETIAFCYGKNYYSMVIEKMKKMPYYIYDNTEYQVDRLREIELFDIALEFSKDISSDLNLDSKEIAEVEKQIADILVKSLDDVGISEEHIEKTISNIKVLNENFEQSVKEIEKVINYYKNDYKVKEISKIILNSSATIGEFKKEVSLAKGSILDKYFGIGSSLTRDEVERMWQLLSAFNPSYQKFTKDSKDFEDDISLAKREFYACLNIEGESLEEIEQLALEKGLFIDSKKYINCYLLYRHTFDDLTKKYFSRASNIEEICNDLNDKGYTYNRDAITTFLMESKGILGASFHCYNEEGKPENIVIYTNDVDLYSSEFNETFIHETIHYLGGNNYDFNKVGLSYNNDMRYNNLEEAFTNYLAKEITKEYCNKNEDIVPSRKEVHKNCAFDCTVRYMEKVFKLYRKELLNIQTSTEIDLEAAKLLCPIEEIATSVTKIVNADLYKLDEVIDQEIDKLMRRNKR